MSEDVDPVLEALSGQKAQFSYVYLNNFGRYRFEVQGMKRNDKGRVFCELKVIRAEATPANEKHKIQPHMLGEVLTYTEDTFTERKGGGARFNGMLLKLVGEENKKVCARIPWLVQFFKPDVQAGAYLEIDCEVRPRIVDGKDGQPDYVGRSESWTTVPDEEIDLAAINVKRAAAKLPTLETVLAKMNEIKAQG